VSRADTRPRCAATVRRDYGIEERGPVDEPCGRLAKSRFEIGSKHVWLCHVHDRKLRASGAIGVAP
jgi:hypothetical protein